MTGAQRLAIVNGDENQNMGDEGPSLVDTLEASLFDALTKRLKTQEQRIAALEAMEVKHRNVINKILTRFVTERRPISADTL